MEFIRIDRGDLVLGLALPFTVTSEQIRLTWRTLASTSYNDRLWTLFPYLSIPLENRGRKFSKLVSEIYVK